jgi:D-hexose-6-phosphate mutarotase
MFNNHQLKDIGMSFGVGLPLKRTKSSVNVNLEFGKKGTQKENLIQENYTKLSLNFTLHEYWFVKRKFD